MNKPKVPPPKIYDSSVYYGIEDFFYLFEKYANSIYGDDQLSWVQVLPDFLNGEPRCIVESFGIGVNLKYDTVKTAVIEACGFRLLGSSELDDFLKIHRRANESLVCFSIRLRVGSSVIPGIDGNLRSKLMKSQFINSLSPNVQHQLNVQFAHKDNVKFWEIVRLSNILEKTIS